MEKDSNQGDGRPVKKTRVGVVKSAIQDKTIVIETTTRKRHTRYKKIVTSSKKFYAHDENNEAANGDTVLIEETRPYSKMKRWRLVKIKEKHID